ncbi:MAG: hypothetical protein ACLTBV_30475 [Enterocloster bolteae]
MDVPDKLNELGLYPADGYESDGILLADSDGERAISRGSWRNGATLVCPASTAAAPRPMSARTSASAAACVRFICDSDIWTIWTLDKKQPEPKKRSILAPDIGRIKQVLARQEFQYTPPRLHTEMDTQVPPNWPKRQQRRRTHQGPPALSHRAGAGERSQWAMCRAASAKQKARQPRPRSRLKTEVTDHE